MLLDVEHTMRFRYDAFVHQSWLELRVEPRTASSQTVQSFLLSVGPPAAVSRYVDWNGNVVHHFGVPDYHDRIEVVARSTVEVHPPALELAELLDPPAAGLGALLDLTLLAGPVQESALLHDLEREIGAPARAPVGEQIAAVGALLRDHFEYRTGVTDSKSTTDEVLEHRSGVCQDFAHLMLGLLRLRKIPSRYVSGYLHVTSEGGEPSQSHAWVEVFAGERGWIPFDPTHDRVPGEDYVRIGAGRHYDDVPPNRGVYRGQAQEVLEVQVKTQPGTRHDAASLQQLIGEIDVPVYRELPDADAREERDDGDPRQQQQQQQQGLGRRLTAPDEV